MENNSPQLLRELHPRKRQRIAEKLSENQNWLCVAYYFESTVAGVKKRITEDYLRSLVRDGNYSMKALCHILVEHLAETGARLEDFLKALTDQKLLAMESDMRRIITNNEELAFPLQDLAIEQMAPNTSLATIIKVFMSCGTLLQLAPIIVYIVTLVKEPNITTAFGYQYFALWWLVFISVGHHIVVNGFNPLMLIIKSLLLLFIAYFRSEFFHGEGLLLIFEATHFPPPFAGQYIPPFRAATSGEDLSSIAKAESSKSVIIIIFCLFVYQVASKMVRGLLRHTFRITTLVLLLVVAFLFLVELLVRVPTRVQQNIPFILFALYTSLGALFALRWTQLKRIEMVCIALIIIYNTMTSINWFFLSWKELFSDYTRSLIPPTMDFACLYCFYILSFDDHKASLLFFMGGDDDDIITNNYVELQNVANPAMVNDDRLPLIIED